MCDTESGRKPFFPNSTKGCHVPWCGVAKGAEISRRAWKPETETFVEETRTDKQGQNFHEQLQARRETQSGGFRSAKAEYKY